MGVYVGKDPYHQGFQGEMKGWNFAVGKGAFRAEKFDELFNEKIFG